MGKHQQLRSGSPKGTTGPVCLRCLPDTDWSNPEQSQGSLLPDGFPVAAGCAGKGKSWERNAIFPQESLPD